MKTKNLFIVATLCAMALITGCSKQTDDVVYTYWQLIPVDHTFYESYREPSYEVLNQGVWEDVSIVAGRDEVDGKYYSYLTPYTWGTPIIDSDPVLGTWYPLHAKIQFPTSAGVWDGSVYNVTYRVSVVGTNGIRYYLHQYQGADGDYGMDCYVDYSNNNPGTTVADMLTVDAACGGVVNHKVSFTTTGSVPIPVPY